MASKNSLMDVLKRFCQNELALEAAVMVLALWAEIKNALDVGYIKQGLARLIRQIPT